MDFIGGLPKSRGMDTILVVVDRLSKYSYFLTLSHPYLVKDVAHLFITEVVRYMAFPNRLCLIGIKYELFLD